jgi:hypothetical protein
MNDRDRESKSASSRSFVLYTTLVITSILPIGLLVYRSSLLDELLSNSAFEASRLAYLLLEPLTVVIAFALPVAVLVKELVIQDGNRRSWFNLVALNVGILSLIVCGYILMSNVIGAMTTTD